MYNNIVQIIIYKMSTSFEEIKETLEFNEVTKQSNTSLFKTLKRKHHEKTISEKDESKSKNPKALSKK